MDSDLQQSPSKYLSNKCIEIQQVVHSLRMNNFNGDVADIFDMSFEILSSLVPYRIDPTSSINEQSDAFDSMLQKKEKEFLNKSNNQIADLGFKVDELLRVLEEKEDILTSALNDISKIQNKAIEQIEKQHETDVSLLNAEFVKRKNTLLNEEKNIYLQFESELSTTLGTVSKEYNEKIHNIDEQINQKQRDLQEIIHQKHLEHQLKTDNISKEERRMAEQHEQLSRQFQERKNVADNKIRKYTGEITNLKKAIEDDTLTRDDKMKSLEESFMKEREDIVRSQAESIDKQNYQILKLNNQIEELNQKMIQEKNDISEKQNLQELEYKNRIIQEETITENERNAVLAEIDNKYKEKIDSLFEQITKYDSERNEKRTKLLQIAMSSVESKENDINTLSSILLEEREAINAKLIEEKTKLEKIKSDWQFEIEELRHELQKKLGSALTNSDNLERKHAEELSSLMNQFDDQQKKLENYQRISLENQNRSQAERLEKIKQLQLERKKQTLERLEKEMKSKMESDLKNGIDKEVKKHETTVVTLKAKVGDIQGRIEMLNKKVEDLYNTHNQMIEKNKVSENTSESTISEENIEDQLVQTKVINDESPVSKALILQSSEVNRRKGLVLQEAEELSNNISRMQIDFESKMQQIEHQFKAVRHHVVIQDKAVTEQQRNLKVKIEMQETRMNELGQIVEQKQNEIKVFEDDFRIKTEEIREKTKSEYEETLVEVQKQPTVFENEMLSLRESLQQKITELSNQLLVAKNNTENISKLLLIDRQHEIEEIETEYQLHFEEKIRQLEGQYTHRIGSIRNEIESHQKEHEERLAEIQQQNDTLLDDDKKRYELQKEELENEYIELMATQNKLNISLQELLSTQCESCAIKKKSIKSLLDVRRFLIESLERAKSQQDFHDRQLDIVFNKNTTKRKGSCSMLSKMSEKPKIISPILYSKK